MSTSTASTNTHDALKQGLDALKKSITLQADGAASVFASQQQSLVAHQQAFVTFLAHNDAGTRGCWRESPA